jgi:hypothetical protein
LSSRQDLSDELDSYRDTVDFLVALVHELSWDSRNKQLSPGIGHEHGAEQAYAGGTVTPDLALLLEPEWGVLGEAKIGFAKSEDGRLKIREQLLKYDAAADRWVGTSEAPGRVKSASTIMLTHLTRRIEAADYLDAEKAAGRFTTTRPFAIVAAARLQQGQEFIHLERSYGNLVPKERDEKLRKGVPIRLDHIRMNYAVRFYDSTPPLALLLQTIWDDLLPSMLPEDSYGAVRKGGAASGAATNALELTVNTRNLSAILRDRFSMRLLNPNLPESPRKSVVEGALQTLVAWNLAKRLEGDDYLISYRKLRRGTLEFILRKLAPEESEPRKKKTDKRQFSLFPDNSGDVDREPE